MSYVDHPAHETVPRGPRHLRMGTTVKGWHRSRRGGQREGIEMTIVIEIAQQKLYLSAEDAARIIDAFARLRSGYSGIKITFTTSGGEE